ncbi:MAG: hypothetical protein S4CHLAM45_10150 [Chlamydiales bacterium]|nr:hypothetical protein [Chlamydiales bacterium]MCH9620169.1 hypothetical protein [Chlamydiales bacterium]MCH9623116.1 hypothetical protein [Chlamydiales bacterium]
MKKKRTWPVWTGVILVGLLGLIAFLPMIASTPFGNRTVIALINHRISGTLSIDRFKLSWFDKQSIDHLHLTYPSGHAIISAEKFETKSSLFSLMSNRFGKTTVEKPFLYLVKDEEEVSNVEKALSKKGEKKKKKKKTTSYPTFTDDLVIKEGKAVLDSPKMSPITISDFEFEYQPNADVFHLRANTEQEGIEGDIFASGTISKELHILAQINHFPVAIFDQLRDEKFYTTAIGRTLDCKIETTKKEGSFHLSAEVSSENLNGTIKGQTEGEEFVIDPESHLIYTLTPATFQAMIGPEQQKEWSLASKSDLKIAIKEGVFPLKFKAFSFSDLTLRSDITMDRAEMISEDAGPYSLNTFEAVVIAKDELEITASGQVRGKEESKLSFCAKINEDKEVDYTFSAEGLPYALLELFFQEAEVVHTFFGETITLQACGEYKEGESHTHIEVDSFTTKFEGNIDGASLSDLSFDLKGERTLQDNWRRVFGQTVGFTFSGRAAVVDNSFSVSTVTGKVNNPYFDVDVRGRIGEKGKPFSYDQLQFIANGTLLKLPYEENFPDTALKEGNFVVSLDGAKNEMIATGKVSASIETEEGKFDSKASEIKIVFKDFIHEGKLDWEMASANYNANFQHFPVAIIDPLFPEGIEPSLLTGPFINAKSSGSYNPRKEKNLAKIDLTADSDGFNVQFSVAVNSDLVVVQPKPAKLHWVVTPERYRALIKIFKPEHESEFFLSKDSTVDFEMKEFKYPKVIPDTLRGFLCQAGVFGTVEISPMVFMSAKSDKILTAKDISGSIKGENFSEKIEFDLKGNFVAPDAVTQTPSLFSLEGEVQHLWTQEGKVDREALTLLGDLTIESLPVYQITGIIPMEEGSRKVSRAVLGESLDANITGEISQMKGPLTIDVQASNFKALIPLELTPNAILLRDYVDAEITLTEAFSNEVLIDVTPLITGARSSHPIKLFIDPEDFSIEINPFRFKGIHIGKGIIDIGKIQVQNGTHIQALMDFLKARKVTEDNWMEAWITPIFFSMKEGTVTYKRFDLLLASDIHIALWGRIDLVKDKVKMILGIAPSTLATRFNLSGLTKNDMFQLKMRGKSSSIEVDWNSAYTRIGIIIARLAGGNIGYLFGGVLEQLLGTFGDEKTPPPTTQPYPWGEQSPSEPGEFIPEEASTKPAKKKGVKKALQSLIGR